MTAERSQSHQRRRRSPSHVRRGIALVLAGASLVTLIGFVAGAITSGLDATPADAHAILQSTEPGAGSTVKRPPRSVTLHFDEQVEVSFGSVRVYNTNASRVDEGHPSHPAGDSHAVRLALPRLADGSYVVTWRVISADSHPVHGAFTFRIGTGQASDTTSLTRRLLAADGGNTSVGAGFATDRVLAFASVLVLIGGTVFLLGVWPEGRGDPRAEGVLLVAWCGAIVTTVFGIPLQGLYAGALPFSKLGDSSLLSSVLDTRFGKVWLARAIVLVLLAPIVRRAHPIERTSAGTGPHGSGRSRRSVSRIELRSGESSRHRQPGAFGRVRRHQPCERGQCVARRPGRVDGVRPGRTSGAECRGHRAALLAGGVLGSGGDRGVRALPELARGRQYRRAEAHHVWPPARHQGAAGRGTGRARGDQSTVGEPASPSVASGPNGGGRHAGPGRRRSAIGRRPRHRRTGGRRRRAGPAHTTGGGPRTSGRSGDRSPRRSAWRSACSW